MAIGGLLLMVAYGLVLAGGKNLVGETGQTFGDILGNHLPKEMLPLGHGEYERPVIFYSIRNQMEAGVDKIFCIVSPEKLEMMRSELDWYFGTGRIEYVVQVCAGGTAHAVECLGNLVEEVYPLLTSFGDEFIWTPDALLPLMSDDGSCIRVGTHAVPENEAHRYGKVVSSDSKVTSIVEKSNDNHGKPHVVHAYYFGTPEIYRAAKEVEPGIEDTNIEEKQLSLAVNHILTNRDVYESDVFEVRLDGDSSHIKVHGVKTPPQYLEMKKEIDTLSRRIQWKNGWFPDRNGI